MRPPVWHGTQSELERLMAAVRQHCTCQPFAPCAAHMMLTHDQRAIDGLLWMRRYRVDLMVQESH